VHGGEVVQCSKPGCLQGASLLFCMLLSNHHHRDHAGTAICSHGTRLRPTSSWTAARQFSAMIEQTEAVEPQKVFQIPKFRSGPSTSCLPQVGLIVPCFSCSNKRSISLPVLGSTASNHPPGPVQLTSYFLLHHLSSQCNPSPRR